MAVLKSKDFAISLKSGNWLSCAENLLWSMDSLDVTHKKGRFSTRWRTSHAPASQARDSTRPRGARARRARRRRGLGPVWRNSTRGAARASQHTRSRPAATPQHVQINGDSTPGSLRVGRARGAAEGSQQGRVAAQVHDDGCAVRRPCKKGCGAAREPLRHPKSRAWYACDRISTNGLRSRLFTRQRSAR